MDIENLLKAAYKKIKASSLTKSQDNCLSDDELTCFFDKKLDEKQRKFFNKHLVSCSECAEKVKDHLLISQALDSKPLLDVPGYLVENAKALVSEGVKQSVLDIILDFTDKAIRLIETTGEILMGSQLIPVPVLRSSGRDQELSNQIKIVKAFKEIVVEIEVEKERHDLADVAIRIAEKDKTKKAVGFRVSLFKGDREFRSLLLEQGKAKFEEVKVGKYKIVITKEGSIFGVVNLTMNSNK